MTGLATPGAPGHGAEHGAEAHFPEVPLFPSFEAAETPSRKLPRTPGAPKAVRHKARELTEEQKENLAASWEKQFKDISPALLGLFPWTSPLRSSTPALEVTPEKATTTPRGPVAGATVKGGL